MSRQIVCIMTLPVIADFRLPIADCQIVYSLVGLRNLFKSAIGNRKSPMPSLVSQRHQRIDLRRSARWYETGEQRNSDQNDRHDTDCQSVCRSHTKQQSHHQSSQCKCTYKSNCNTDNHQHHSISNYEFENIDSTCAECHANADLLSSLRYCV